MPETPPAKNYFDPRVLSKIARLELRARLVVEGFISGLHRSPYHGFSVEFAQHREYVPGDDIRHIDWKVWGRADRFFLKQYEEETNLEATVILDCSRSMLYGEDGENEGMGKFTYACTLSAVLAFLLQRQQDAVGLMLFDRDIRSTIPPSAHPRQLPLVVKELENCRPDHRSDVDEVFAQLPRKIWRRGLVIIVSDLLVDVDALTAMLGEFRHRRQEVVLFHVLHEDEATFPFSGNTLFRGLETPVELMVEAQALREGYLAALDQYRKQVRHAAVRSGCDYVFCTSARHLDAVLSEYLARRKDRRIRK